MQLDRVGRLDTQGRVNVLYITGCFLFFFFFGNFCVVSSFCTACIPLVDV